MDDVYLNCVPDCTMPVMVDLSLGGAHFANMELELGNITPWTQEEVININISDIHPLLLLTL